MSVAGCLGSDSAEEDETVEVLHGWTGGDGKEAIEALVSGFQEEYPDVEGDFDPVGSDANIQLNNLIVQRLGNEDPPSSWAAWPGKHLTQFTESDLLGDISESVWSENGMEDAFLEEAKELSQFDGQYVAVPIGSHRLNNLFYNVSVIEEAGIDPSSLTEPGALVDALAAVEENTEAAGMAQAMTASNTVLQMWAATMLGSEGYQAYMDLIEGNGDVDAVANSLEYVAEYAEYFNEDADTVNPPGANQKIMNGEAGFLHQGNWMAGAYRANDLTYEEDWGWVPFPGTENMYTLHFDSFVYPANGPAPDAAANWLSYCGSVEGQVEFNKRKGSIPARTDAPRDEFGPFLQQTMEDFNSVEHKPPTIAHGLAVPPGTLSDLRGVISNSFMGPYNVEETAQGIVDAIDG
jgi:glucose/mannose transport system substrate-binding protein